MRRVARRFRFWDWCNFNLWFCRHGFFVALLTGNCGRDAETAGIERRVSSEGDIDGREHIEAFIADIRGCRRSKLFKKCAFVISECCSVVFSESDDEVVGADPSAFDVVVDVVVNGTE